MALQDIVMPKLGLTMTEGTLAEWRVKPGDRVSAGDTIFVVETDKIANEIEAPAAGEIREIVVEAGHTVPVGTAVARWTGPGLDVERSLGDMNPSAASPQRPAAGTEPRSLDTARRILATPLARRLGREIGIDLRTVVGSGPRGRIKAADVRAAKSRMALVDKDEAHATPSGPELGTFERADSVRATIAKRLTSAKQEIPHFYVATEAEVSALHAMRDQLNAGTGLRISVNHVIVAAVGRALVDLPEANRIWRNEGFTQFASPDVGVAVQTSRGLLAPVLRAAGRMILDDLAARALELVRRSREGRLGPDDMAGGAITVSNVGMHDVTYLTPIINPGQSAILGVGSVREVFRPDANGAPVLKREIGLVLAADHRVFDGVSAAALLKRIVHYLEHPVLLTRLPQ